MEVDADELRQLRVPTSTSARAGVVTATQISIAASNPNFLMIPPLVKNRTSCVGDLSRSNVLRRILVFNSTVTNAGILSSGANYRMDQATLPRHLRLLYTLAAPKLLWKTGLPERGSSYCRRSVSCQQSPFKRRYVDGHHQLDHTGPDRWVHRK